ncbi:MAG: hypothetical protein QOJ00_1926 [Actinomycetota bacterium]
MLNNAAKYALGLAALGVVAAIATRLAHGDRVSAVLLIGVALVAAIIAFGENRAVGTDLTPFVASDDAVAATPVDPAEVPRGSVGPLALAVGAGVAAAGGALGPRWVIVGAIVALVGIAVWIFDTYRTPGVLDTRDVRNLDNRLLGPIALPVGAFLLAITIAICFSRVLLAVNETASWVIAFIVAAVLLGVLTLIADRRPATRIVALIAGLGMLGVLVAGGAGASEGERQFESKATVIPTADITAHNISFDRKVIGLPADSDTHLVFTNLDVGTFHNVAIYTAGDPGSPVFNGKPIAHGSQIYNVHTPAPGTYRYVCDFHPAMTGELRVTASSGKGSK